MVQIVVSYETALQTVFNGRVNIRKETMELEVSERILALKIHKKELTLSRLNQLVDDTDHCRVCNTGSCSSTGSGGCSCSSCCFQTVFLFYQLLCTQIEGDVGSFTTAVYNIYSWLNVAKVVNIG